MFTLFLYISTIISINPNCGTGELIISNSINTIEERQYEGCSEYTGQLTLPRSIKQISNRAFYGCSGLDKIEINTNIELIGEYAFGECSKITTIIFPSDLYTISKGTFFKCTIRYFY